MSSELKPNYKTASGQSRKIIYNVYSFFKKEAGEANVSHTHLIKRTAQATGLNASTVQRIIKEISQLYCTDPRTTIYTPGKRRYPKKPVSHIDNFDLGIIKRYIHNFHVTNKEIPTIAKLLEKLRDAINFKGGPTSLRRIINELGFKWKSIEKKKKIAVEQNDIRLQRINYLKSIKQYRKENRPIIYTDEAIIHILNNTTDDDTVSDGTVSESTVTKKKRTKEILSLTILLAGTDKNFIPNTLLLFKHGKIVKEYRDTMSYENYEGWLKTSLIPNLPPKSVVVVNNIHYQNIQCDSSPNSYSSRALMCEWLTKREIPFTSDMLKPELYQLIKVNRDKFKINTIDKILSEHDHSVLRLPSLHPDLNPVKMIWQDVQTYVIKNAQLIRNQPYSVVREKLNLIEINEWKNLCDSIKAIEEEYSKCDQIVDQLTDEYLTPELNYADSSSIASDDSEINEVDDDKYQGPQDLDKPSDSSTNKKRKINDSVLKSDSDDSD